MLKIIGIIFVVVSCSTMGVSASVKIKNREKILCKLCISVKTLSERIEYSGRELSLLLPECFGEIDYIFTKDGKALLKCGLLPEEDTRLINDVFSSLGTSDKKGECEKCEILYKMLAEQHRTIQSELKGKQKIYITVGICAGVGLAIMLI